MDNPATYPMRNPNVFSGNCYVFDLDGTLFDVSHRLHHIKKEPKDWDAFFAATRGDAPIQSMIRLARDLRLASKDVLYVTGRPEKCRADTTWAISEYSLPPGNLMMRPDGDFRDDSIVKVELIKHLRDKLGFHPIAIFEDRKRVVEALREEGFTVLHVADGDF